MWYNKLPYNSRITSEWSITTKNRFIELYTHCGMEKPCGSIQYYKLQYKKLWRHRGWHHMIQYNSTQLNNTQHTFALYNMMWYHLNKFDVIMRTVLLADCLVYTCFFEWFPNVDSQQRPHRIGHIGISFDPMQFIINHFKNTHHVSAYVPTLRPGEALGRRKCPWQSYPRGSLHWQCIQD